MALKDEPVVFTWNRLKLQDTSNPGFGYNPNDLRLCGSFLFWGDPLQQDESVPIAVTGMGFVSGS
jgi:hypothetical protein